MARARNIKPGFFANDELAQCEYGARLMFVGLWCLCDREGRLEDRPVRIKGELFPYDNCDADSWLQQLAHRGFITRYEVDNRKYIQVNNFLKHQNPHIKEAASTIPAPCKNSARMEVARLIPESLLLNPESLNPSSLNPDSGIMNASAAQTCTAADAAASEAPNPELLEWLVWWNSLKSDSLVPAGVSEDEPSQGVLKGWARAQKNPRVKKLLRNRDAIEREIRESSFCRENWFRLEKIFGGVNRDGELVLQKLLEGGYRDKPKSPGGYDRNDPLGNMATVAAYLEGLSDGE